jgi:UPF0042 nucleotide-binding protein
MDHGKTRVVIVSGLSGAGKSVALRALEDAGFFCIDNLPVTLIESFLVTVSPEEPGRKVGIGVDIREKGFLSDAYHILTSLRDRYQVEILFLEAESEVIARRFKETRRPHPIVTLRGVTSIEKAIEDERLILSPLREAADRIIDTSNYSPHQLRHQVLTVYDGGRTAFGMTVSLISFGYKFGVPQNVDLLFDVRFLPNPFFVPELKALKGTDRAVVDYVLHQHETSDFLGRLCSLLDFLIPKYLEEGRAYLAIGLGCTGGRHRSPVIAQEVASYLAKNHGIRPQVIHRDMGL